MGTKLELVNHMLATIGERVRATLDDGHPSAIQAIQILDSNNADFQARGWWFNTETSIKLAPNSDQEILLPDETTEFRISATYLQYLLPEEKNRYVARGNRVYDSIGHTYQINRYILADLTLKIPVESLPAAAFSYLKHLAAQAIYEDDDGDETKVRRLEERKDRAWQQLQAAHLKAVAPNHLDSPAAQQLRYRVTSGMSLGNPNLVGGGRYL